MHVPHPTQNKAQWPPSRESAWPTRRLAATSPSAETSPSRRRTPRRSTRSVRGCWRCSSSWCVGPQSSRSFSRSGLRNVLRPTRGGPTGLDPSPNDNPLLHIHNKNQQQATLTLKHTIRQRSFLTGPFPRSSGASVFTSRKPRRDAMSPVLNALQNLQHLLLLLSTRLAAFRHEPRDEPTNFDPRFTTVLYSSHPCERLCVLSLQ